MRRFMFLYLMLCPIVASSQSIQWIGLNIQVSNVVAHRQERSNWCWAASAQMVLDSYGLKISQDQIVQRIHGDIGDRPGTDEEITSTLNGSALIPGGKAIVQATLGQGFPTSDLLIEELSHGRPLVIGLNTGKIGHAVVVTAAGVASSGSGLYVRSLIIRDPWPSPEHIATAGRVEYDGLALQSFAATVDSYWTVHVSVVPGSYQAAASASTARNRDQQETESVGDPSPQPHIKHKPNFETHPAHSDIGPDEDPLAYAPIFKRVIDLAERKQLATLKGKKLSYGEAPASGNGFEVNRLDVPTTGCIIKEDAKYLSYYCEIFKNDVAKAEVEAQKLKDAFYPFGPLVLTDSSKGDYYQSKNYTLKNGIEITIGVHSEPNNPSATVEINNKE